MNDIRPLLAKCLIRPGWTIVGFCGLLCIVFGLVASGVRASDPARIVGANACAECHTREAEAWKGTHHFSTFREMPRSKQASEIAKIMGVQRIRSEGLCLTCHYTVQQKDNKSQAVSGISCESCHSGGQNWIKIHSGFSGKTEQTETKAEAAARWKRAEDAGMIRPSAIYRLAKNCYSCHVVPQEDLVNKGGHSAGSDFELVSWSQGEVRHNTWHSKGKANTPASASRRRMLYLIGLGVELETGLRSIGNATARHVYAFEMARRVDQARKQLSVAAKALPAVPEVAKLVEQSHSAGLKLDNKRALTAAADEVAKILEAIGVKYDGSTLGGVDSLIPAANTYKGTAKDVGSAN